MVEGLNDIEKAGHNKNRFLLFQAIDIDSDSGMVHWLLLKVPVFHKETKQDVFLQK